jgi:hypothetical protein
MQHVRQNRFAGLVHIGVPFGKKLIAHFDFLTGGQLTA